MEIRGLFSKIKEFFAKNEYKIVLVVGFCLVSAVSFGFGAIWGQKWQQKPVIIEKLADTPESSKNVPESQNAAQASTAPTNEAPTVANSTVSTNMSKCAFVGSKNSDKFYVPTCSWAKRIKPENLVCYPDEQSALAKGKIKSDCK